MRDRAHSTATAALGWARAVGEFGATIMFAGSLQGVTQTAPIATYLFFEQGDFGTALALGDISRFYANVSFANEIHKGDIGCRGFRIGGSRRALGRFRRRRLNLGTGRSPGGEESIHDARGKTRLRNGSSHWDGGQWLLRRGSKNETSGIEISFNSADQRPAIEALAGCELRRCGCRR